MEKLETNPFRNKIVAPDVEGFRSGFSLIEVVMAMAILSIGILSAMQMGLLATRNITSGNIVTQAVLLAQSEIEKIQTQRTLIDLSETFAVDPNPQDYLKVAYQFIDPLAEDIVGPTAENCETSEFNGSGTCLATVTVSWSRGGGGRGGRGEVQLKTLLGGSA